MNRNLSVKIVESFLIILNNLILTLLPFIEKNKSRVAEPTSDLVENKITDKITGTVTSNPKDVDIKIKVQNLMKNQNTKLEIPKERYITVEKITYKLNLIFKWNIKKQQVNNNKEDNARCLDAVMSMHNLLKYSIVRKGAPTPPLFKAPTP